MTVDVNRMAAMAHLDREARQIFELWQSNQGTAAVDAILMHGAVQAAYLAALVAGAIIAPMTVRAQEELAAFQGGLAFRVRS